MGKKKKQSHRKWIVLLLLFLLGGIYFGCKFFSKYTLTSNCSNTNYSGIGQKSVTGKDGYLTTFTTSDGKIYKEYKQNGNSSWSERYYWGGTMAENGCGITCLATLVSRVWIRLYTRGFAKTLCSHKKRSLKW